MSSANEQPDERPDERDERRDDLKLAALGGVAAAAIGGGGMAIVGTASAFEARRLLEAILPSVRALRSPAAHSSH